MTTFATSDYKFGVCTWTLGIKDLDLLMKTIAGLDLNAVQYCEPIDAYPAERVLELAKRYNLEILIVDPFDCRPGDKNGVATFDNAIAYYKKVIDFADKLGCGATLQGLSTWTENSKNRTESWQMLVRMLQVLDTYAVSKNVSLSYEPCNLYEVPLIHTATEFQQLISDSGCKNISILMDSFHMNIGEADPLETIKQFAARNSVFHISDSNREGIGSGNIDFKSQCHALFKSGFFGPYVFEFVLKDNPVNTPPRDNQEMSALSHHIVNSKKMWLEYLQECN